MPSSRTILSQSDKSAMQCVARFKGGELLKGPKQFYFVTNGQLEGYAYEPGLLDFLMEWGNTPFRLTPEQQAVVDAADQQNGIALRVVLKNGKEHDYCVLNFIPHPPPAYLFERSDKWYYITDVASMTLCPQYVPAKVMAALKEVIRFNEKLVERLKKIGGSDDPRWDETAKEHRWLVLKDAQGKLYKFDDLLGPFVHDYSVDAASFQVMAHPTPDQLANAKDLSWFDHEERGNRRGPEEVLIFADGN